MALPGLETDEVSPDRPRPRLAVGQQVADAERRRQAEPRGDDRQSLPSRERVEIDDDEDDAVWMWTIGRNFVRLEPGGSHVLRVAR